MSESKYEILGELDFKDANGGNVPVNISLVRLIDTQGFFTRRWVLDADNYRPLGALIEDGVFRFVSEDRELLVSLVQKHWRPLYEKALEKLALVPDERGEACMYYWE